MKLKFVSDGTYKGTQFINAETGERVEWITKATIIIDPSLQLAYDPEKGKLIGALTELANQPMVLECLLAIKVIIGNADSELNLTKLDVKTI